jgi:hypothetical protein
VPASCDPIYLEQLAQRHGGHPRPNLIGPPEEPPDHVTETDHPLDPTSVAAPARPIPDSPDRIDPDDCLGPGRGDSRRLLITWFVKKSFWWMTFGGLSIGWVVHAIERNDDQFEVQLSSPDSVISGLLSAYFLVVIALLVRVVIGWVALALAYPLARSHEGPLEPRTGKTRHWGTISDRYKVAKAYRLLRWTHHVRQAALDRIAPGPSWWRRMDPIIDRANVLAVVGFFVTSVVVTTIQVS